MTDEDRPPDPVTRHLAEGEAALVLLEGLLLTLIDRGVVTREALVEAVDAVIQVKRRKAEDGVDPRLSTISAGLLSQVMNSLSAARTPDGDREG